MKENRSLKDHPGEKQEKPQGLRVTPPSASRPDKANAEAGGAAWPGPEPRTAGEDR